MAQGLEKLCEKVARKKLEIAPALLEIEEGLEALRAYISETGQGFTVVVDGVGTVEGKAGADRKLKGVLPVLKADAFLDLSEARRAKLIGDGLVEQEEQWQPARKPSVTVRL